MRTARQRCRTLRDGRVCYVRKGYGPTLLLLHGAPLSLMTWRHNLRGLTKCLDVIAPDLKGFGFSQKGPGNYSPDAQARFTVQLLDRLGVGKVNVMGSSYGCAVAFAIARNYPDRIDKLVLINSVGLPYGPHSLERVVRIGVLRKMLGRTLRSALLGKRLVASRLRGSYADQANYSEELAAAYFAMLQQDGGEASFLACLEELQEDQIARQLPTVQNETLIIWGEKDHVLPVKHAHHFVQKMPNARLKLIPHSGHFPHEEDHELVNEEVLHFIGVSQLPSRYAVSGGAAWAQ